MNRNDFGFWGINLNPEEFSKAIAALGLFLKDVSNISYFVNDTELTIDQIVDSIKFYTSDDVIKWEISSDWLKFKFIEYSNNFPARLFADAWTKLIGSEDWSANKKLSIRAVERESDIFWLIEQLSRPEVGISSVFAKLEESVSEVVWDYPLRIGLLDDEPSNQFRLETEELGFDGQSLVHNHIEFIDIKHGQSDCNILLLPYDLKSSVAKVLECPNSLRADCVFVLGNMGENEESSISLINALRTQARSVGVYLFPIFPTKPVDKNLNDRQKWFKNFIREVSHDNSIDVALSKAYQEIRPEIVESEKESSPPILFATQGLIYLSRISRRMIQLGERLSYPNLAEVTFEKGIREKLTSVSTRSFGWTYSDNLIEMGESLLKNVNAPWDSENATATELSEAKRASEILLEDAPAPEKKPRWIQTEVWEETKNKRRRDVIKKGYLVSKRSYSVEVFIGSPSKTSISGVDPVDVSLLPPDKNEHELTVVFSEPQITSEPKVETIILPQDNSNSTKCAFYIQIPEGISQINARIIISHRNRVLQTALLKAPVAKTARKPTKDAKIELITESVIRPGMQDLSNRQWFDTALILNQNIDDTPQLTKLENGKAMLIPLSGIQERVNWFREKITKVAAEPGNYTKLTSKKSVILLRAFAQVGKVLLDEIKYGQNDTSVAKAERIQIITTDPGKDLPIEFAYNRKSPTDNSELCPNAVENLKKGKCSSDCPTGDDEDKFICPLAFWGLSRVIERHAYNAEVLREINADFALRSEPIEGRTKLKVLTNSILATSNNVDKEVPGSSAMLLKTLEDSIDGKKVSYIKSWQELKDVVERESPSLLVLLPHTRQNDLTKLQILEISEQERLTLGSLESGHIQSSKKIPAPVVFLMGCKTSNPEFDYEKFVNAFRANGAALVIASGSVILGRYAAIVTAEFIKALKEKRTEDVPFGDILLKVRREKMAEGLFMMMALTSYGDTDWLV